MNDKKVKELGRKFDTQEARAQFIREAESGIYAGKDDNGLSVIVYLDQSKGMRVFREQPNKTNWLEVVDYNSDGEQESVTYEPKGKGVK